MVDSRLQGRRIGRVAPRSKRLHRFEVEPNPHRSTGAFFAGRGKLCVRKDELPEVPGRGDTPPEFVRHVIFEGVLGAIEQQSTFGGRSDVLTEREIEIG